MGCCFGYDVVPDTPKERQNDPDYNTTQTFAVHPLGLFGFSRDYGIYNQKCPETRFERREKMWMWFNKSTSGPNQGRIDLENFERGHIQEQPKKGKVLYYATFPEKPTFEYFQRLASTSNEHWFGMDADSEAHKEDSFYVSHETHVKNQTAGRVVGNNIITKWRMTTQAQLFDGEKGRGADNFQKDPVILEVVALGTCVTSYTHHTWKDKDGHSHSEDLKYQTKFVDRVEFRLSFRGALWDQWFIVGDSVNYGNSCDLSSPFYETHVEGGWFSTNVHTIKTLAIVDPCFALLLSQVCHTEYSCSALEADLIIPETPHGPYTSGGAWAERWSGLKFENMNPMYKNSITFDPSVNFKFQM